MKPWIAILFTAGLAAFCYFGSRLVHFDLVWILVPVTALWAAMDSSKMQLRRYKSGISCGPIVVFIGCAALWIVVFPWYLTMRHRIMNGTAVLKPQYVQS